MALKGAATIELTNADGSKEIIKHDNMITNAVNDMCISQRGEMASILKIVSNNDSYAQSLFGGLLLFDETLSADADDYFLPTCKITGYASQDAYAGLDIARGSFNQSEGGVQEDGSYKFVWDFSTSQGNGTIKSLALCPDMMGKIGASNTIQSEDILNRYLVNDIAAPFNSYGRMLKDAETTEGIDNYNFCVVAVISDVAYAIELYNIRYESSYAIRHLTNTKKLRFYKFSLGSTSISLIDRVGMAKYIGYEDVSLPDEFIGGLSTSSHACISYTFDYSTNRLIVFPCYRKSACAVQGTIPYIDIEMKNNMNINSYIFKNTTAGKIEKNGESHCNGMQYNFYVGKDYIVTLSTIGGKKRFYVVKRSDNTQVKEVKTASGDVYELNSNRYFEPVFVSGSVMIARWKKDTPWRTIIIDMENGIIKETNAAGMSVQNNVDIGNKVVFARTGPYLEYRLTVNPFVLTTKNNLDSPVVKTASQTMKITYTLSEVSNTESGAV